MSTFETIAFAIFAGFFVWLLIRYVRKNPTMLTMANFSKTARSLAFLAILLILVVWFCVVSLNS